MKRIGIFVCQCGMNIAGTIDVERVVEEIRKYPEVVYAIDYRYMCSDPGQRLIAEAIQEHGLDRIVVAACSPSLHEPTFRGCLEAEGLNPYMVEIANIREQCSWVHDNREEATEKSLELVHVARAKVAESTPLFRSNIPITKRALVSGGGLSGIQAALDIGMAG